MLRSRGFALLLLTSTFLVVACGDDPPDKEMQQAQSAIDAARVAGAADYAHDELVAAEQSLKNAHDAVGQRDYRLALTSAFDSRERARTAQTQAVDQKIVARGEAERLITDVSAALAHAHDHLKTAAAARPARQLVGPRRVIGDVDRSVQEARTAFAKGDYVGTIKMLMKENADLAGAERDLNALAAPAGRRRR
jgi:cellobiose-specific phosphotransferase system component IIA